MAAKNILFLGCGKMGSAMAKNLLNNNEYSHKIDAIDPSAPEIAGINFYRSIQDLPKNYVADIIFISVKPQIASEILSHAIKSGKFANNALYISILAGKKIKFFKNIIGKNAKIIRTMPNLPIVENQGVFAYLFSSNIKDRDKELLVNIFENFGETIELDKEGKFDQFTAIFGSGPAYIFHLQEALLAQAKKLEIADDKAEKMVERLLLGTSLMAKNSDQNFSELRQSVTSKDGTTQAGLDALRKNDALEKIVKRTVGAAAKRSKELSK